MRIARGCDKVNSDSITYRSGQGRRVGGERASELSKSRVEAPARKS